MVSLKNEEIRQVIDSNHERVNNWPEFVANLDSMSGQEWIFRGVSSSKYYLVPSIGREKVFPKYKLTQEKQMFKIFKKHAGQLHPQLQFDDWTWLAYAQHHGVPTRLLDWTMNPYTAAFFALNEEKSSDKPERDRVVYCVKYPKEEIEVRCEEIGPYQITKVGRLSIEHRFDRLKAQCGLFTVHPKPTSLFFPKELKTILVEAKQVDEFRRNLFKEKVDFFRIYPDMEGLAKQLCWQYKTKTGLGSLFTKESKYY